MRQKGFALIIAVVILAALVGLVSVFYFTGSKSRPIISTNLLQKTSSPSQLKDICQKALADYFNQAVKDALVVWQDNNGNLYYRLGPKASSMTMGNVFSPGQKLNKLVLIDKDNVGYWLGQQGKSVVGSFSLNNPGSKQVIYESQNQVVDVAFIDKDTAVIASVTGSKNVISKIENQKEITIGEMDGAVLKLALSPKNDLIYANQKDDKVGIFDIQAKKSVGTIDKADELTWLGDGHLLYRNGASVYLYDLTKKEVGKVESLEGAQGIAFHPGKGGLIGFLGKNGVKVVSCPDGSSINSNSEGLSIVFTNDQVAFVEFKNGQSGYWEFDGKSWIVKLSDGLSMFGQQPVVATLWNKY